MMSDDDFLSRWSRRKRSVVEETEAEDVPKAPAVPEPETAEEEEQILSRLQLPVPETLKPGDDFSAFMSDGVPEFLRRRALRVLWRSNPVLANLDGLNDYDDDFTSPELTQKVLATAYQVGRGFVSQASEAKLDPEEENTPEPEDFIVGDVEEEAIPAEKQASVDTVAYSEDSEPSVRPRRMRFET